MTAEDPLGFDESWEHEYLKGNMLNRYPFDILVSLVFNYFGRIKDRSKIKVLDIGCGAGNNSLFLAKEGFSVTGIDASRTAIDVVNRRFKNKGLTGAFHRMMFEDIDQLNDQFDLIIDREALCTSDFDSLRLIFDKIAGNMHQDSLFISFFYNTTHPDRHYCTRTDDNRTYYDLKNGVFGNSKRVTLLDEQSIQELFSNFEIIERYDHKIEPLTEKQAGLGGMCEYITVAKVSAERR